MSTSSIRSSLELLKGSADPDTQATALAVLEYLETRDPGIIAKIPRTAKRVYIDEQNAGHPAALAVKDCPGHPDADAVLEIVALLIGAGRFDDPLVFPKFGSSYGSQAFYHDDQNRKELRVAAHRALIEAGQRVGVSANRIAHTVVVNLGDRYQFGWTADEGGGSFGLTQGDPRRALRTSPEAVAFRDVFEELVWKLPDAELIEVIMDEVPARYGSGKATVSPTLLGSLAKFRPELLAPWIGWALNGGPFNLRDWNHILAASERFDPPALELAPKLELTERLRLLMVLSSLRGGAHRELAREAAIATKGHPGQEEAFVFLADFFPTDLAARLEDAISKGNVRTDVAAFIWDKVGSALASIWDGAGRGVYEAMLNSGYQVIGRAWGSTGTPSLYSYAISGLLKHDPAPDPAGVRAWLARAVGVIQTAELDKKEINALLERLWAEISEHGPKVFREELFVLLGDKLKSLRQIAVKGLATAADGEVVATAERMLTKGKLDQKLGAAALLAKIGDDASVAALTSALAGEQNDKVRAAIHEGLEDFRKVEALISPQSSAADAADGPGLVELETGFAKQAAKLKLPSASWLKAETLPAVFAKDGSELSKAAIAFLISKQAKHKNIEAAPDVLALLSHIDREKSAPFGLALVEGFLNSEQAAADRWALTLGGLLGDKQIIPPLLSRINDWCENSRHKLAEYSAQAISLLPGNEALMVLDTLSNRYRSKFKNVGKACAEAFAAAAAARGITPDELGDMVVPDFGFDAEGIRLFEWEGGKANAELGADFKLSWSDPDTEKSWKALPASAPEAVKTEVKTLTKLLKEAVKGQTARLEMTLVRQRRWPVARWRELYENHPLLRSFASNLVWGIYDASGTLLRTFRRYPNGLLANAAGDLEELPEEDTMVGMVHPLEMDAAALETWRAHLARFKVKQPFPQIDRPVELLDPLHGNRREITLSNDKKVGAGTFKSRSEKRGWFRGSVIDAGGISSIYKPFPGAGFEAILPTNNYYMGIDPMDSVELESAYFVKSDSVGRGSYTYDEPAKDDPRVLRFDQVPAVVWSETISDLKAIIGA